MRRATTRIILCCGSAFDVNATSDIVLRGPLSSHLRTGVVLANIISSRGLSVIRTKAISVPVNTSIPICRRTHLPPSVAVMVHGTFTTCLGGICRRRHKVHPSPPVDEYTARQRQLAGLVNCESRFSGSCDGAVDDRVSEPSMSGLGRLGN